MEGIDYDADCGPVINVKGTDLMDGTPIYDIKPYLRYSDSRPEAVCGYVDSLQEAILEVSVPDQISAELESAGILAPLVETLSLDPRPSYHNDPQREYGMSFSGYNVKFKVTDGVVEVIDLQKCNS